jgi:hypothetical protein
MLVRVNGVIAVKRYLILRIIIITIKPNKVDKIINMKERESRKEEKEYTIEGSDKREKEVISK